MSFHMKGTLKTIGVLSESPMSDIITAYKWDVVKALR